ncbi:formate dehydrogenase subunit delta [Methylotetracoccus oryzae]|uniref:formate dehydrogenase subunit delta n=1 Tax=Methylotetracoccus oryzae TaxID=1919059 RepID=UPI00111AB620|nr:formate dehydrogenase subunit delta [Methylotetracoccus oryzae]
MQIENLVKMVNDIAVFFEAEPERRVAVHSIADHVKKFWDPRMRRAIIQHNRDGGFGLSELSRLAVHELDEESHSLLECGDG